MSESPATYENVIPDGHCQAENIPLFQAMQIMLGLTVIEIKRLSAEIYDIFLQNRLGRPDVNTLCTLAYPKEWEPDASFSLKLKVGVKNINVSFRVNAAGNFVIVAPGEVAAENMYSPVEVPEAPGLDDATKKLKDVIDKTRLR